MDKAFFKRILIVVMGICAAVLLFSFVSLIIDAVGFGDLIEHAAGSTFSVMLFEKWTFVATVLLMIPLFASYIFSCISKNRIFSITSAVISLLTTICAISFICVLRKNILSESWNRDNYANLTAYMQEMIQVIVPCLIGFIYFTVNSVVSFTKAPVKTNKAEVR